jgi:hypothetical protein
VREYQILDPFVISMWAPTLIMPLFFSVGVLRKRFFPWPIDPCESEQSQAISVVPTYILSILLSAAFFALPYASGALNPTAERFEYGNFGLDNIMWPLVLCALGPLPLTAVFQLLIFGKKTIVNNHLRNMQFRYLEALALSVCLSLSVVPLSFFGLSFLHLSPVPVYVCRETAAMAAPLSLFPTLIVGILLVFYDLPDSVLYALTPNGFTQILLTASRNRRFLNDSAFRSLQMQSLSDDDLHGLLQIAMEQRKSRVVDEISERLFANVYLKP